MHGVIQQYFNAVYVLQHKAGVFGPIYVHFGLIHVFTITQIATRDFKNVCKRYATKHKRFRTLIVKYQVFLINNILYTCNL